MPHFPHTPESLLPRSDSKNPATTCKGITSNGRPCRRALASPKSSPQGNRASLTSALNGVVAVVQDGSYVEADFYCWQHKDQAEQMVEKEKYSTGRRQTELFPLQERSSIDTLVQRLGITSINDTPVQSKEQPRRKVPQPPRRTETRDFALTGDRIRSDYWAITEVRNPRRREGKEGTSVPRRHEEKRHIRKQSFWAALCCMKDPEDDDYIEIVRHKRRTENDKPPEMGMSRTSRPTAQHLNEESVGNDHDDQVNRLQTTHETTKPTKAPLNPPVLPTTHHRSSTQSQTGNLLSLIPQHLSPQTASALLTELTKPISQADEQGYIYIFWLTPQTAPPATAIAANLLKPPEFSARLGRRVSDAMTEFSHDGSDGDGPASGTNKKTITLKIGRANNVTRRMNEWQRQCGYALNLVRWYPYVPSSATPSPAPSPRRTPNRQGPQPGMYPDLSRPMLAERRESEVVRKVQCVKVQCVKVQCVKRVERLIHLELAEKQVRKRCAACGKEHREWFEIEASQAGVRAVDETVRRWVGWADRMTQ